MPPRHAALIAVLGVLLLALLVVVLLLVGRAAAGGNSPTSAATSIAQATAAPTLAQTPSATPTAAPATAAPTARPGQTPAPTGQTILAFVVPPTVKCDASDQTTPSIHLSWTTANATGVSISIDGPGKFADYPATGSADVPFACSVSQHTYLLTTHGTGTPATRTVVVKRAA